MPANIPARNFERKIPFFKTIRLCSGQVTIPNDETILTDIKEKRVAPCF